jgi:hypothetical protein
MDLQEVHAAVVTETQETLAYFAGSYRMEQLGEEAEKLCVCFQALGICHLLETAEVDPFRENLVRSGQARRYFLKKSRAEGNHRDRHLAISRTEALLDLLAAGHLELAQEIVQLSQETWDPRGEYEDDFCYYRFLHLTAQSPDPLSERDLAAVAARFEQSLEGAGAPRLELCKAVLSRSSEDFRAALEEILQQQQDAADKKRSVIVDSGFLFWPRSFVSVEGLALLKIAEMVGIPVEGDVPLCPEAGRLPTTNPTYLDLFQEIDKALAGGGP